MRADTKAAGDLIDYMRRQGQAITITPETADELARMGIKPPGAEVAIPPGDDTLVICPYLVAGEPLILPDPAMHQECAEYALRVCPFLAAPRGHFSNLDHRPAPAAAAISPIAADVRPDRFMLGLALGFQLIRMQNQPAILATPWQSVQWWRHGSPIE